MLKQLIDYAKLTGLEGKSGFQKDYIKWIIVLNPNGDFLSVTSLENDLKAKGDLFLCPKLSQPLLKTAGAGARHFLGDTTAVVTQLGIEKLKTEKDQQKLVEKHNYFASLIRSASESAPSLTPVKTALTNEVTLEKIREALEGQSPKAKVTQNISFAVLDSDGAANLFEANDWHPWYEQHVAALVEAKAAKSKKSAHGSMRSLATGESVTPAKTHPKLSGLSDIGGNASVALASFKPPSFRHFGLSQSENAAVSAQEAATYAAAANQLIRESRHLAMGKVAFWCIGPNESMPTEDAKVIVEDALFGISETEEPELSTEELEKVAAREESRATSKVAALLDSYRTGKRPELGEYRFVAMSLGANASRLVVREYMEGEFISLLESVESWFDDLSITKLDSRQPAKDPTIARIISAPLPPKSPSQKYMDWIKPVTKLREPLWRAAVGSQVLNDGNIQRQPFPRSAIELVLPTLRAAILNGEVIDAIDGSARARSRLYCRMALLKIFLVRNGEVNVNTYLNESHPNPAYQCGRLLAVLANIQQQALGDVGANVVQRFYSRASTAPADAIGPIISLSNAHLNKLDTGLAVLLRDKVANIFAQINSDNGIELPQKLDAKGQSLFALGYYQQIASDRQQMIQNAAAKKQKSKNTSSKEKKNE